MPFTSRACTRARMQSHSPGGHTVHVCDPASAYDPKRHSPLHVDVVRPGTRP
jgi:hypothetical protein